MDKNKTKTPTEALKFGDIWDSFKSDYLPFVEWMYNSESEETFCIVEFTENAPIPYTNKWSREQFKIRVNQDQEGKILSAGKKLFVGLKKFCILQNNLPVDLGLVCIVRIGSGFDTDYQFSIANTSKK